MQAEKIGCFGSIALMAEKKFLSGMTSKEKWALAAVSVCSLALLILLEVFFPPSLLILGMSYMAASVLGLSLSVFIMDYFVGRGRSRDFDRGREGNDIFNQDIILVLRSKADHNGATQISNGTSINKLKKQKKYAIVCRTIETVNEMSEVIHQMKKQGNRIHGLWIHAHGEPHSFAFGEGKSAVGGKVYEVSNESNLWRKASLEPLKPAFEMLQNGSSIVLDSCSTGKVEDESLKGDKSMTTATIAQTIADLAPHCRVYAPIQDAAGIASVVKEIEPFEVNFYEAYGSLKGNILQRLRFAFWASVIFWMGPQYGGKNITACFKAYPH